MKITLTNIIIIISMLGIGWLAGYFECKQRSEKKLIKYQTKKTMEYLQCLGLNYNGKNSNNDAGIVDYD